MKLDKYRLMTLTAFVLSLFSAVMTALGMSDLFQKGGILIFLIFVCIDLGRFLLFNFLTDEWKNLRKIKYVITLILVLLFGYSAVGIFSQLSNMISPETHQAMLNAAAVNKAAANASVKETRATDLAKIARQEYNDALTWNKNDYENCLKRAKTKETQDEIDIAENKCNNTKRWLDNKASKALKDTLAKADESLNKVEETTKTVAKNQSDLASILTTICEIGRMDCGSYQGLHNALSIIIALVIVGTDYLQIAIVLAVNTRKNKLKPESTEGGDDDPKGTKSSTTESETKKKDKSEKTETQKLSKKASKKLAKRLLSEPKPNDALNKAMKDYEKIAKEEKSADKAEAKPSEKVKKVVKTKAKAEKRSENTITDVPNATLKTLSEQIPSMKIEMSEAQQQAVNKIKEEIEENKKVSSGLNNAFDVAKKAMETTTEKSSKIKRRKPRPFSVETSFM